MSLLIGRVLSTLLWLAPRGATAFFSPTGVMTAIAPALPKYLPSVDNKSRVDNQHNVLLLSYRTKKCTPAGMIQLV